jgi:hypothetical protein
MPHFPQSQTKVRSPRVRVPNEETIRFNVDGRVVRAVLLKVSLTGGLAEFPGTLGGISIAEAMIDTALGPVKGLVEFIRAQKKQGAGSCTYPFRFIALSDGDYRRLNATLQAMRKLGLSDDPR